MASLQGSFPAVSAVRLSFSSSASSSSSSSYFSQGRVSLPRLPEIGWRICGDQKITWRSGCGAMVQQAVQGTPAAYAKEMERLSAKESLLLAFKDSGGFEALVTGKTTDMQRIDVNERIIGLERLNSTPRPTTSPYLEGRWSFEWFGPGSPGLFAARFIFERFPLALANLSKIDMVIRDGYANVCADIKLLSSIENKFTLATKLSIEGPLRMKEEYIEAVLESPKVIEETVPEQLRGAYGQAVTALQQLPVAIRDVMASGLRVPLDN
ncbi:probable plastid-lipid-associated protein 13, chloroplastic isoform X2 [Carica papaya]|uniref:probable plastid-lipid-associated protein 13, chloroplastic isoform X2 n=1 Tax=Carica papaya TaxID=3649 RepID=UPI000B8C85CC|nr:probable plastid-lipid-associated protein 13, chloroplastic isoform X2 [Carica papaya]